MARTNQSDTTILYEHKHLLTVRYVLAIVNFLFMFLGALVTRHFITVRGISDGMLLHVNLLCGLSLAQIIICAVDYVSRCFKGIYSKFTVGMAYVIGALWVLVMCGELFVGIKELGDLRLDLTVIAVLQLLTGLLAYLVWPSLDYSFVQKMTGPSRKASGKKRAFCVASYVTGYAVLAAVMLALQVGMILAYQLPPRVYDLFSDTRALEYTISEDKTGYYVTGLYRGTSSYVQIPETYNEKPVIGIAEGALSDSGFLDKHKVKRIDLGVETKDENGNTVYRSNLRYLEEGAINCDKLETLRIPVSVISIQNGAIQCDGLRTVLYEAKADFAIQYFDCQALQTVTLSGDEVGNILSLEGLRESVTIEVSKENYNLYRQKNIHYGHSLRPILSDSEFYVDIYTECEYYINSIFGTLGESVYISVDDLYNEDMDGLCSPSVDTLAYMEDPRELGTLGARLDSAFRGWYFDRTLTSECVFREGQSVEFTRTGTLYAKWIDEYTGTLNWGTYQPADAVKTLYWTDEDITPFPVVEDRVGYSGGVQWYLEGNDQQLVDSNRISESVTLNGVWILDKPTVDIEPSATGDWYSVSPDKNAVEFTYDEANILAMYASFSHVLDGHAYSGKEIVYSLSWSKVGSDEFSSENTSVNVQNVPESGEYVLDVLATSPYGETSRASTDIRVNIHKKQLNIGDAHLEDATFSYEALNQTVNYTGTFVDDNIKVTYTYYNADNEPVSTNEGVRDAGSYRVEAFFEKRDEFEAQNYGTQSDSCSMVIEPRVLTFDSWTDSSLTYNGESQSVNLRLGGVLSGDEVEILYNHNTYTDAGTYLAEAIGLSNANYTLSGILEKCRCEWTIAPKEVTVKEWKLDDKSTTNFSVVYSGNTHSVTAVADGVIGDDAVNFLYDEKANTVSAIHADTYTAKIIGVDNANYVFKADTATATKVWTISKKPVTVTFGAVNALTYNGKQQGISATVSGIVSSDLSKFNTDDFLFAGKSDVVAVSCTPNTATGQLELGFTAINAAEYTASVSGISDSAERLYQDYTLTSAKETFAISPKRLTVVNDNRYTYTGKEQSLVLNLEGFVSTDLADVRADQFKMGSKSTALAEGKVSGSVYALSFKGTAAKSYPVVIDSFGNGNYTLSAYNGSIDIARKALTVTWNITDNATGKTSALKANNPFTYNYSGYSVGVTVNGVVEGETVTMSLTNANQKNAANYETKASLPASYTNYSMADTSIAWLIQPYEVNFSWAFNGTVSASAVPTFTYSAADVSVEPRYTLLGDDTVTLTYTTNDAKKRDVGSYSIAISGLGNSNYELGTKSSVDWKITPKTVTVKWDTAAGSSTVYNGAYQGPQFSLSGILETDNCYVSTKVGETAHRFNVTSTDAAARYQFADAKLSVNAGKYTCDVVEILNYDSSTKKYVTDPNYTVSCTATQYTIQKRTITLSGAWTYQNSSKGTGQYVTSTSLIYNSKPYTLTTEISDGLVQHLGSKADVTLVYTGNVASNYNSAGYTAKVSSLSGTHADNYALPTTNLSRTWSIGKKVLNFSWSNQNFVFNGNSMKQEAQIQTGAATDTDGKIYTGDVVTMTYSNNVKTDAGTYEAKVTALSNANYSIGNNASYEWSIAPKPISLSWNTTSFVYNGQVQKPQASYTGNSAVKVTTYSAENSENVGEYRITATALNDGNYVISGNQACTYTIKPLTVSINWLYDDGSNANGYTYDGKSREVLAQPTNLCAGDALTFTYDETNRIIKNAGSYTFKVVGLSNPNYALRADGEGLTRSITVEKRTVTIQWSTQTFVYDGAKHTLTPTVTGVSSSDIVGYNLNTASNSLTDVGSVSVSITSLKDANYKLPSSGTSATMTINPQPVTITWSGNGNLTYDGSAHTVTATVKGTNDGKTVGFSYNGDRSLTNAGSITVKVTSLKDSNYTLTGCKGSQSTTLNIAPKPVTVTWSGTSTLVYDGKAHSISAKVTGVGGEDVGFTYGSTQPTQTNAGSYTVSIQSLLNSNYTLSGASNTSKTLTIQQQKVTISWPTTKTFTYDGSTRTLVPTVKGADDNKVLTVASYNSGNSMTNAGSLTVAIKSLSDANYTLSGADGATSVVLKINPQIVEFSWIGDTSLTHDGKAHSLTVSVVGKDDGRSVKVQYGSATSFTNAGTYTVSFSLADSNYTLTGATGITSKTLTIAKQPVDIVWKDTPIVTYDGVAHSMKATVTGRNDGENVRIIYGGNTSFTKAGSYQVSFILDNTNYTFEGGTGSSSATLTINPQPVKITWTGTGTFEYNGSTHTLAATVKGANNNANVSFSYTSTNRYSNAGNYSTGIKLEDSNYTLTGATGSTGANLTITAQPVVVTWTGTGTSTYTGNKQSIVATVKGATDGKTVEFTYKNNTNSYTNVGTYSTSVASLSSTNYTLAGVKNLSSPSLTINPQEVVITWSGTGTFVYNGNQRTLSATVKGALDGDTVSFNYAAGSRSYTNVGTYTAKIASLTNSNYTLADASNITSPTLTIAPQQVTITWKGTGKLTYDGASHTIQATVVGAQDGKNVSFNYASSGSHTNVGDYTAKVASLNNSNYTLAGVTNSTSPVLTILPQMVTITWSGTGTFTYDGSAHTITATVKGADDGKTVSFDYMSGSRSYTNAGSYSATVLMLNNNNYTINGVEGRFSPSLVIVPQPVSITWTEVGDITYDGKAHTLKATVKGALDGKTVDFNYSYGTPECLNVGSYTTGVSGLKNSNYTLTNAVGETEATVNILHRTVEVQWSGADEVYKDGEEHRLTATIAGLTLGTDFTVTEEAHTEAGTYTYFVKLLNKNCIFSGGGLTVYRDLVILESAEPEDN